jgi:hypothetical protein
MHIDTELNKVHKENQWGNDKPYESFNKLGLYFMSTKKRPKKSIWGGYDTHWQIPTEMSRFFIEGYLNIKPAAEKDADGNTRKHLALYATNKFRAALKNKRGKGISHIVNSTDTDVIAHADGNNMQTPDIIRAKIAYERNPKYEYNTHALLVCGAEWIDGKYSFNAETEKRIRTYTRAAKTKAKVVLTAKWRVMDIRLEDNKLHHITFETINDIAGYSAGTQYSMSNNRSDDPNDKNEYEGYADNARYKVVRDCAMFYPNEFYATLRAGLPAGLSSMFPAAILSGFMQLRELIEPDDETTGDTCTRDEVTQAADGPTTDGIDEQVQAQQVVDKELSRAGDN